MNALLELADECERIVVPSREMDLAIARQFDTTVWKRNDEDTANYETTNWHYTASIDAARSLVPDGWDWSTGTDGKGGGHSFLMHGVSKEEIECDTATPALALCAAALRARAAAA